MAICSDARWFAEILKKRTARGCLLVFVADEFQHRSVSHVVSELYYEATQFKRRLEIIFPVLRALDDEQLIELWTRYNPELIAPRYVLVAMTGESRASFPSETSATEILATFEREFPVAQAKSRRRPRA